ncbi:MAG: hypothetical protein IKA09_07125 [Lachnospiraceae bacterium]|nr:hypothetical protein [Lachnospiraceae bacterium]
MNDNMKVQVKRSRGHLKIDINGKLYEPLSFKSFRPNPQNVSEFYQAGVRLFSVLSSGITSALGVPYSLYGESWIGEGKYDFSAIDRQMDMFIKHAPEAYFAPMLQVDTRDWYLEEYPDVPNSFTHLSQTANDSYWRKSAADYLKAAIAHCEEKYGDRIYGYFLLGGTTTEWFSHYDKEASHPIKEAGYRQWTGEEQAVLPTLEELNRTGDVFLTDKEQEVYRARKFHSETIADLILYFVKEAQSVVQHNKLIGLYYGYLFELGGERLYNDGVLAYEKIYLSPDVDMISSPSAYGYRKITDPSAFMVTQRTLDAHNKLYFLEFDHITHVAPEMVEEPVVVGSQNTKLVRIPGAASKCNDEMESLNLMFRDYLLCNANGAAMWWFDMFDGWFRSEKMMGAVHQMLQTSAYLAELSDAGAAEIAVIAEGESMYRVRKSSNLATTCLSDIRRTLAQTGAPYDLYSVSDIMLSELDKYKLYIFVNQYDMSEKTKQWIAELKKAGKAFLWLYAPDYATNGALDVKRIRALTGMRISESRSSHGSVLYKDSCYSDNMAAPYFDVQDEQAVPLAFYEDGAIAAAYVDNDGSRDFYVATCNLASALLRDIARLSGVHIYSEHDKVYTYVNDASLGVYNATEEAATVYLKEDGYYKDLLSGQCMMCKKGKIVLEPRELRAWLLVRQFDM